MVTGTASSVLLAPGLVALADLVSVEAILVDLEFFFCTTGGPDFFEIVFLFSVFFLSHGFWSYSF